MRLRLRDLLPRLGVYLVAVASCATEPSARVSAPEFHWQKQVARVQEGMTLEEVERILPPNYDETLGDFVSFGGGFVYAYSLDEEWMVRVSYLWPKGFTSAQVDRIGWADDLSLQLPRDAILVGPPDLFRPERVPN